MARNDNIVKQTTEVTNEYLKFIEQSFNTNDVNFKELIDSLNEISKSTQYKVDTKRQALNLVNQLKKAPLLIDFNKYDKFEKLALNINNNIDVYRLTEDIIKDVNVARDWLASYNTFKAGLRLGLIEGTTHEELLMLGKSILGRAIELTPIKTGTLRASGFLADYKDYIVIGFGAPYATYVHENLAINHPNHASNPNCGGRAKFLELALQEFFPDRSVWVEVHGISGVFVKIGINPLYIEYSHYN